MWLVSLLRNLLWDDREGLWELHLDVRKLSKTAHEVYDKFMLGGHVVKRFNRRFSAVGLDMVLEQTINRSQKSSSTIIGDTMRKEFVTQWEIAYHVVLLIANFFRRVIRSITTTSDMKIHHELYSKETKNVENAVWSMVQYVAAKGNPFDCRGESTLHNMASKEVVGEAAKTKLLQVFDVGKHMYESFRNERFISKSTRISATIHRYVMPTFTTKNDGKLSQKKKSQSVKIYRPCSTTNSDGPDSWLWHAEAVQSWANWW